MLQTRLRSSLALVVLLSGCPRETSTKVPVTDAANPEQDSAPLESEAGIYFAVDDRVVRLSEAGVFTTLEVPPGPLRELQVGPEGRVVLVARNGLLVLEGERFVPLLEFDARLGEVGHVSLGEGVIWALGSAGIGRFAAGEWTIAGKLEREVDDFASPARGPLHLLLHDRVVRFEGPEALTELPITLPFAYASELALAGSGRLAIAGPTCELALVDTQASGAGGASWARSRDQEYGCESPSALGLDGHDRIWVGSATGVHVLGAGGVVQAYPSGSVPELVGALRSIAIVGEGPIELPSPGPVQTGGIAGKIEFRGKPAAKAKLEICPRPAPLFHASPCDQSPLRMSTTTAADGSFVFEAVPLARYGWALQIGDQWTTTEAEAVVGIMRAGEVLDLGVQRLE